MVLAQVIVFAKDVAAMQAFYQDALGLALVDGAAADGWVRLDAGGCRFALHAIPPAIAAKASTARRSGAAIKLAFAVDDVDAARAALVARGVEMGEVKRFGAVSFCDGVDPEGNVFQVTTRR